MKMGWICDNDEENHKYKSKTTATAFEIQTRGIHPRPPPPAQEGFFIIIIIIIIIITDQKYYSLPELIHVFFKHLTETFWILEPDSVLLKWMFLIRIVFLS